MSRDLATLLALLSIPGAGNVTARRALHAAEVLGTSVHYLTRLSPSRLIQRLPPGDYHSLAAFLSRCTDDAIARQRKWTEWLNRAGAHGVLVTDPEYPPLLTAALGAHAPALVFYMGDAGLLHTPGIAVVGARRVSDNGARLAQACARFACDASYTVVSGAAPGVDSIAHKTALDGGGRTVMVLPMGLVRFQLDPELHVPIREGRLLVMSEFPPTARWETHNAVTRNATIAALARLICVIEPRKAGGSARTAQWGLAQRKPVFVHVAPGQRALGKSLLAAGASPLVDETGAPDLHALARRLEEPSTDTLPLQGELF